MGGSPGDVSENPRHLTESSPLFGNLSKGNITYVFIELKTSLGTPKILGSECRWSVMKHFF